MKILVIGGTVFVGRHLVTAALSHGHQVTLFNRGRSNPDLFPQVERLKGDRAVDLSVLAGRRWDAAIDTCGYFPRDVQASVSLLAPQVGHYTFISTISVYAEFGRPGLTEDSPLAAWQGGWPEDEVTGDTYGPLKVQCEAVAEEAMPGRVFIPRPGLIVGPHDPTDRFTYWAWRTARGGELLAPGRPDTPVQFIDGRDLADWILALVEAGTAGVFNATGPREALTMNDLLSTARAVSDSDARPAWVPEAFLLAQDVEPWRELPLWLAGEEGTGWAQVDNRKAVASGLSFRPLEDTLADTLAWQDSRPRDYEWRAGLSPEREAELLQAWHKSDDR